MMPRCVSRRAGWTLHPSCVFSSRAYGQFAAAEEDFPAGTRPLAGRVARPRGTETRACRSSPRSGESIADSLADLRSIDLTRKADLVIKSYRRAGHHDSTLVCGNRGGARRFRCVRAAPRPVQGPGLGGYGASSSMAPAGMGASGPIIPYGGSLSGFMPSRMGGGGTGLSFSSRNSSMIGAGRGSFRLSAIGREMSMSSGGVRAEFRRPHWDEHAAFDSRARRWDEPSDGNGKRERHAAQFRLSLLSAAKPALAFVGVHGNVVDVTAP